MGTCFEVLSKGVLKAASDLTQVFFNQVSNHASNIQFEKARKEMGKKSREDKHVVTDKLFALFEKHQYYSFSDLVKETRQPAPYLKVENNRNPPEGLFGFCAKLYYRSHFHTYKVPLFYPASGTNKFP